METHTCLKTHTHVTARGRKRHTRDSERHIHQKHTRSRKRHARDTHVTSRSQDMRTDCVASPQRSSPGNTATTHIARAPTAPVAFARGSPPGLGPGGLCGIAVPQLSPPPPRQRGARTRPHEFENTLAHKNQSAYAHISPVASAMDPRDDVARVIWA